MIEPTDLIALIKDFQESVKEVVTEFYSTYGRKDLLAAVISDKMIPRKGRLNSKVYKYAFHGSGLYAKIKGKEIDFDFGPDDRIDGFDAWRLHSYIQSQKGCEQWSLENLESGLAQLTKNGIISKPGTFPGSTNYYFIR